MVCAYFVWCEVKLFTKCIAFWTNWIFFASHVCLLCSIWSVAEFKYSYFCYSLKSFSHYCCLMVLRRSLSDCKSPQVFRTLLSILADLFITVFWVVSSSPLISQSSCPWINPLRIALSATITISITVTFMFLSFYSSLATSRYLSLFSISFNFTQGSAGTAKSTIRLVLFCWLSQGLIINPSVRD